MYSIKSELDNIIDTSSSENGDDPDFDVHNKYAVRKKKKKPQKKSQGVYSLTKLREKCRIQGIGTFPSFNSMLKAATGGSSLISSSVAMTAAQPSFTTTTMAPVAGGGGGDGGGGGGDGGVVVQQQQQQQQLQSVSITQVHQQVLTGIVQQNGVIEVSLDSPGDSSNGGAQVTAQVVVSSGNNTPVGSDHSGSEQSLVSPPHYITVTVSDGEGVGTDTVAQGVPTYVQYVEGSPDQAIYQTTNGQMAYPVYTVGGEGGAMYTPAAGQYYSSGANPTTVTYSQVASALNPLQQGGGVSGGYLIQQAVDPAPSPASTLTADVGVSYMVTGGQNNNNGVSANSNNATVVLDDNDPHSNLSHATRISPATPEYHPHSFFGTSPMLIQQHEMTPPGLLRQQPAAGSGGTGKGRGRSNHFSNPSVNAMYRNPSYLGMVQWLLENYETAEGVSLPRSTLYNHYLRHCNEHKLDPVNAASFGKLIRSVFLGLRTRRLGTRGNSKYHYYGIRIKPSSALNQVCDDGTPRQQQQGGSGGKRFKFAGGNGGGQKNNADQYEQGNNQSNHSSSQSPQTHTKGFLFDLDLRDQLEQCNQFGNDFFQPQGHEYEEIQVLASNFNSQRQAQGNGQHLQYLGDSSAAIPEFPDLMAAMEHLLPGDCTLEDVDTLRAIYREHFEAFLDAVVNLEFNTVDSLWREFWRSQDNNNGDECEEEKYLSKTKLYMLCKCEPVQQFIRRVDYLFYQNLVEVLIPDVLRPIPSSLTQSIRNFAKGLECWLTAAMTGCPPEMTQIKVSAVGALAQTLRRYTSLNHLAQAARAVLQNATQINQMLIDLNRVDFHNVQEQASWVCQCDDGVVQRLENDFKVTLQQQNSLEQWAGWLKGVVQQVLRPYEGKPNYAKAARQFLLKWSFYSSMVIRDLTLRSAASFGSFHLIRLLYDEYMFYLIEHQVALETGDTPIAVMGESYAGIPSQSGMNQPSPEPIPDGLGLGYMGQPACNGGAALQSPPPGLKMGSVGDAHHHPPAKRHKIS